MDGEYNTVLKQALQYYRSGKLKQAEVLFQECLNYAPRHPDVLHALGVISVRKGDNARAVEYLREALVSRQKSGVLYAVLAVALQNLGRNEEAAAACSSALGLGTQEFGVYNTLGNAQRGMGQFAEARESFKKALSLNPESAEVWFNAGNLFAEEAEWEEALDAYEEALKRDPAMTGARLNAGDMLLELGQAESARRRYLEALENNPGNPAIYFKLGNLSHKQRKFGQAVELYDYAIKLQPDHEGAFRNRGSVLYEIGRYEEAVTAIREAYRLNPSDGLRVKLATLIPPVVESSGAATAIRQRFLSNVDDLLHEKLTIGDPLKEIGNPNFFYMAYYGQNDRELMKKVASLFSFLPAAVPLALSGGKKPRIRVGFISRFFFGHSVGSFFYKMIRLLAGDDDFEVTAFCIGGGTGCETPGDRTLRHVPVPVDLTAARRIVASHGLDILVYTDIGMDPLTYYLAFTRLATTQCAMIGHLVTTGIPAMDYFLSSDLIEPDNGEEHYTESLVKFRGMPCYVERPTAINQVKSRKQLGLPEDRHIYLCPMRLNKIHPEFDDAVAAILRRDPDGVAVFFQDREQNDWHTLLGRRFAQAMPDVRERVLFLPWAEAGDFQNIAACSDVVLDTFYYGGGVTAAIVLQTGTPIVTWPGPYMRGRLTAGFYRMMGIESCIARDQRAYIDLAVALAVDRDFHETVKSEILASNTVLYENKGVVSEMSAFFKDVHAREKP